MTVPWLAVTAALVFALLAVSPRAAAERPSAPEGFEGRPIASIDLSGPTAPDRETFEAHSPLRTGRTYSAVVIRRALEELMEAGDWVDIRVEADASDGSVALRLSFVPRVRISRMEFRGNRQSAAALRTATGLRPGDEMTDAAVAGAVTRLREWYARFAYVVDIVPSVVVDPAGSRARVIFTIRERDRLRLQSITFPGTPAFSRFRHLVALRTAPGEYLSRDHLDRGLERLRKLYRKAGYLTAAIGPVEWTPTARGLVVAVPIQKGTRYRVEVTGYSAKAITAQMTFFEDPRDDEDSLAEEGERLTRFLSDQGYRRATVKLERRPDPDGTVAIRVSVQRGLRYPLKDISITGNVAASDRELAALLATKPGGWWRDRYLKQDVLEADRERLLSWYRSHGFLAPTVTAHGVEADDPPRATAVFAVEEGPQTRFGRIEIDGGTALTLDAILSRYNLEEGSPYVEAQVRAARAAMLESYSEHGYIYATIDAATTLSADRTRADVRFAITEGPAVTVGAVTLSGNERTRDHVILRELDVRTGDVYSPRRIFDNQRRVAQLGFLREVRLEPVDPERVEAVKALQLSVKERDAGSVDVGVGYSNYEGPRGFSEITYRNLLGLGRRASLRVEGSRIERNAVLSYRHPWLFGRRVDGKAAVFHEVREEETRGYQLSAYGVSLGIERTLIPRLFGSVVYGYQLNHFEEFTANPALLPFDEDRANIASLTPSLVWDARDDPFNPRTGLLATLAFENAALLLGSQEQFWKVTSGGSQFIPVARPVVLALGARGGVANRFGETRQALGTNPVNLLLPPTERFYVGGRSSIRGYDEDTVGPKLADGSPIGGNIFLVANAEVRVSLPGSLGVVAFWDGGNAWLDQRDVRWTDIRTTVGGGLRYNTPVGPLRFDYGHKLNWQPGEAHGTFHFTLGHAF